MKHLKRTIVNLPKHAWAFLASNFGMQWFQHVGNARGWRKYHKYPADRVSWLPLEAATVPKYLDFLKLQATGTAVTTELSENHVCESSFMFLIWMNPGNLLYTVLIYHLYYIWIKIVMSILGSHCKVFCALHGCITRSSSETSLEQKKNYAEQRHFSHLAKPQWSTVTVRRAHPVVTVAFLTLESFEGCFFCHWVFYRIIVECTFLL